MKTANGGIQPNISPGPGVEIEDYWLDIQAGATSNKPQGPSEWLQYQDVVFENPSNGWLNLRNMNQVTQLRIFNQVGQLILEKEHILHDEFDFIDLRSQLKGIYFIEIIQAGGSRKVEKLLLQH